ncbi:MAG TPA: hypothetical protein VMT55_05525, partial [Candidatus Sulfotelmatobacter sp.]|nr:hypothetical protein [Candidatus Sulfotelmatobacter sp.]
TLVIEAADGLGSGTTISARGLKVFGALAVIGRPMNYPNPFKPSVQPTTINYKLSVSADVKFVICDLAGRQVYNQLFLSGTPGGTAGENEPTWNGRNFNGQIVGNGVYVYFITSGGKVLGSGEISIYE